MTKQVTDLVKALDGPDDTLEHYGVLGMRWGVRKDRGGKRIGKPVAGTKAAKRGSKSMAERWKERRKEKKQSAKSDLKKTETQSANKKSTVVESKSGRKVSVDLDQGQKSKVGRGGIDLSDLSMAQLKETAERLRLENDVRRILSEKTSTESLQAAVNRIKLEQEYRKLTMSKSEKRREKVREILGETTTRAAKNLMTQVLTDQGAKALANMGIMKNQKKK